MKSDATIDGYRLPQIVLPWINHEKYTEPWQINVINTQKTYSIEKYYNEVLALEYAAARHPLSINELKSICEEVDMMEPDLAFRNTRYHGCIITAGIDWGKGDTASGTSYSVLTIGVIIKGKFHVVFKKRYTG